MPLCLRTSTYFTGIPDAAGSGFGLGFAAACARGVADDGDACGGGFALCVPSVERDAASARIAAHADIAMLVGGKKRRRDAGATGAAIALTKAVPTRVFRCVIACGRRRRAPFAKTACGH